MITRTVLAVDLKNDADAIETYREHHQRVWPEVLASLRRAGVRNMVIYLLGRRLVMVVETEGLDYRRCFAAHLNPTSHPRVAEWETLMRSLQEPPPGAPPGDWWARMEPIFSLEAAGSATPMPQPARRS
jgi:L-rhamnose mutarotase